jgi:tyrosine-protein kinase
VQQDSEGLNFEQALGALRRRAPLILLCVALAAAAAFGLSKRQTKKYTATASVVFGSNPLTQQIAGLSTGSGSSNTLGQQVSDLELVRAGDTVARTARLLGHGLTAEELGASLSIAAQGESSIVDVSATATSPVLASEIANTYARQFVRQQRRTTHQFLESALAHVNKQLAELPPQQRVGQDGLGLQDRAQSLRLLTELDSGNVQVAQEALPPTSPSSPKTTRNTGLGAILGLLLGLGFAFLLERLDRRIKRPEDLEAIYRLPMLGVVPDSPSLSLSARRNSGGRALLPSAEAEAFSLIRAHLRFFNVDRDLRTILIASPAPGDGKTTIARRLAEAAARLGSRVLLVEVDLRHPTLTRQLNIQSGPGLADVLINTIAASDAVRSIDVEAQPGEGAEGRKLDVLTAGAVLPPNPGELLESRAMDAVLEQAKSAYDLVVIDTPPLTAVSDAFPLLTKVDGVVIVGRVRHSRRDAAERLHQVLSSSGAPLLGLIANGAKSGELYAYAYAKGDKSSPAVGAASGVSRSEVFVPTAKS